jgi:hypothetical protein
LLNSKAVLLVIQIFKLDSTITTDDLSRKGGFFDAWLGQAFWGWNQNRKLWVFVKNASDTVDN